MTSSTKIALNSEYANALRAEVFEVQELEDAVSEKVAFCSTSSTSSTSTASTSSGR